MMKIWSTSYRHYPLALWITSTSSTSISFISESIHITTVSALSQSQQRLRQLHHKNHHHHHHHLSSSFGTTSFIRHRTSSSVVSKISDHCSSSTGRQHTSILPTKLLMSTTTGTVSSSMLKNSEDEDTTTSSSINKQLRVALCQFHVTEDKLLNLQTCSNYIDQAVSNTSSKVDLIVLPEIWNSPYATAAFAEYAEPIRSDNVISKDTSPSVYLLQQKAIQHQIYIVGGSIPEIDSSTSNNNQLLYNTCLVFDPTGQIIAKHRKVHLFDIDVPNGITFRESDTLSAGSQLTSFRTPWCHIGIGICYDIRFPEYAMLLSQTCQLLIYPGAFNLITGPAHWELLQRSRAVDTQCYVLTASPARTIAVPDVDQRNNNKNKYPPYSAWGHSTVVAPWGDIIATTDEKEGIVIADIDLTKVDTMRQSIPVRNQKRADLYTLEKKQ